MTCVIYIHLFCTHSIRTLTVGVRHIHVGVWDSSIVSGANDSCTSPWCIYVTHMHWSYT
jgi:hypothetical protein